ncbi:MAG TPA: efflux RND transporter permease subunit, partial [Leptospiraceae bacterium]|nr:efflux RND transporter permease subunit [Leptospiraceae bacterium]
MNLSLISIRNPVFAWMLMTALMFFGAISFKRLGISQMPDVDFPVINVSLSLPGASPEIMESTVTDPVEDALLSVEGITGLNSTSGFGTANITVDLELNR